MPHRPLLPRIALALIGLGAIVQAGACLDFDRLVVGAASNGGGDPDVVAGDADASSFVDVADADAQTPPQRLFLRGTAQAGPINGSTPLVLPVPPGIQPGDLMLLALASSEMQATAVFMTDGGANEWTHRFALTPKCETGANGTFSVRSRVARANEEPILQLTFDGPSYTERATAILSVWAGTDPSFPIDTEIFAATNDLVAPELVTTAPNAQLVGLFTNARGEGATWIAPAGMTTRASTGLLALFEEPLEAPGPTGSRSALSSGPICGAAAMLALRPSP